jgi:peptidyl-prolyl cis-trans isomerase C
MALLVNDELIPDEEFHQEFLRLSSRAAAGSDFVPRLRRTAEETVVHRVLLVQLARQRGLAVTAAEIDAERRRQWRSDNNSICGAGTRKSFADGLLIEKLRDELARHMPRPSRAVVEAFYRENSAQFWKPERVQAAHIFKSIQRPQDEPDAMSQLEQAQLALNRGKPFAAVAERFSDCKGSGGSLGWVERGAMVEEFEAVIFNLKKREHSPIFRTIFGGHIAEVQDRKAAGLEPLDAVRNDLARRLYQEQRQRVLDQALSEAIRHARITTAVATAQNGIVL